MYCLFLKNLAEKSEAEVPLAHCQGAKAARAKMETFFFFLGGCGSDAHGQTEVQKVTLRLWQPCRIRALLLRRRPR